MKTTSKFFCAFVILTLISAVGCKKDTTSSIDPNALLCDGRGTSEYLPFDTGDVWKYDDGTILKIEGPVSDHGNTYYNFNGLELRKNANGDILMWDGNANTEHLYIPANPTVGQVIYQYSGSLYYGEYHVLSVTDSINTSTCKYKNVLTIELTNSHGGSLEKYWYKKGLGLVAQTTFTIRKIKAVTLK